MTQQKPPVPWFGGKVRLAGTLCRLLPTHRSYIEVFGGAGALLFAKPRSDLEVYNDLDEGLVGLYRVLRDPTQAKQLQHLLELTPYSRAEYEYCCETWAHTEDAVERARRWFVLARMSFASRLEGRSGWKMTAVPGPNPARPFRRTAQLVERFTARLAQVEIESRDFREIIARYDRPDALLFCDPPYLPVTRKGGDYRHELTEADHVELLERVTGCQGMVILCGYDSSLYREALTEWQCVTKITTCSAAAHTRATGLLGPGAARERQARRECIWIKPNAVHQLALAL